MDQLDDEQLKKQISISENVKDLANNPGHLFIMGLLKRDADEALEKLKVEENIKEVHKLQNIIWRHDELASKMYTLISMGMEAMEELQLGGTIDE